MSDVHAVTTSGQGTTLSASAVDAFKATLLGNVLVEQDKGYDAARALWNGMIDRKPAMIAQCTGTADVVHCVNFARKHKLLVSIRSGGHNIAGMASANGAMMIDLSPMKSVHVDVAGRTVVAQPGATLRHVDHETQAFGLATPLGINSTTGLAGLTLGGGFGWLSRSLGLTVDNLLEADVVTADGKVLHASEKENADLLWGISGGGGNFGIVTSLKFRLHPVGPQVFAGLIVHPFKDAKKVFEFYKSFTANAPEELSCWIVLRKAPPLPFLPADVHGKEVFVIASLYAGDPAKGEKILEPLRKFGNPVGEHVGPMPYEGWQQAFDPLLTPGARNYWKSHNFTELSDGVVDAVLEYVGKLPTPLTEIFIGQLGGAINRVKPDATAYPHRDANFVMNVHTRWEDKAMDGMCVEWARKLFDETAQYATGGVYVNFISEDEQRVPNAFGKNYERLVKLKKKYDPENFFRTNQNIQP